MRNCPEEIANVLLISGSQDKLSWRNFILAKTLIWVHFWRNVLRIGSYISSSSLQLGSNQHISSDFGNQRYLIGVIDTGCICRVMRLPPRDYCNGWLGMGDDKILGGGSIQMGLHRGKFLRHGACLVLSSPLEMGGLWRSSAAHPRQNLVQCPPRVYLPTTSLCGRYN